MRVLARTDPATGEGIELDPTANLREQLQLTNRMLMDEGDRSDLLRLCTLVEALDRWLNNGGALPRAWAEGSR